MPAVSKKQKKFMQAVANSPKFAKKVGVKQSIGREFTKEKDMKKAVKKMNMGGRAMNDRDGSVAMDPRMQMAMAAQQKQAAMGGMKKGGKVKKMGSGGITSMGLGLAPMAAMAVKGKSKAAPVAEDPKKMKKRMKDREGRAMAAGRLAGRPEMMADARGRAMMKKGGTVKKMKKGGNTSRMNELEELGRVDSEKGYTTKGKKNLKDEKKRVVKEIKNKKAGGKVKAYKKGGSVSSASKRADGIAQRGHTRGRHV